MPQAKTAPHVLRKPAQGRYAYEHVTKSIFCGKFPQKGAEMCRTRPRPTLCASLRGRNARGHVTTHENIFLRIDRLMPALQPTLCASLRGRNAHGQNTRAILCGNLQGKCRAWEWAPRSSTGLYPYRKNPSIWTHCLAKNPENRKGAEK